MSRLFIVRHGNTFAPGEAPRRIGRRTDLPLTIEGEAQASQLGRAFERAGLVFGLALTGPLLRARRTAELILAETKDSAGLTVAPALDEIDHGPDENQPEWVVRARLGSVALELWETQAQVPDGWQVDREERLTWWRSLLARSSTLDTLLVTSNGAARFACLALDARRSPAALKLRTGAVGVLNRTDASWAVTVWDQRPDDPTWPILGQ